MGQAKFNPSSSHWRNSKLLKIVMCIGQVHRFYLLWQYGLWSFQERSFQKGDTTLERFLHKNQQTQRKLLNFEFWINGELSKIGYHFYNEKI